ncbi:protein KINESIN LIGHT CHAIN-RELATED 2 [Impatiens glandulifera]|uniref:protein KINESIN LIGHT CHAIN-RELATED 2 n=1 Tax=Impatiens glandulifera TaxID=253017 RepID=UPI001FB19BFA|nr:protein KINESIN LIGHT CHAIN-RELATED 2 [Impatiens glandulifera]
MRKLSCKSIFSSQSKFSLSVIAQPSSSYSTHEPNLNQSTQPLLKPCKTTGSLILSKIKTHQSYAVPFHNNLNTLATAPQISSRQRRARDKSKLQEAFDYAKSSEDMLIAFKVMETSFDERELGLACLKLGLKLDQEGEDPEKALTFANRALNVFDKEDSKASLPLAMTLQLLGSTCYSLKRFNDGLGYLNRANRILVLLEEVGSGSVGDIHPILHAVQLELANTKTAMGRREEAITNLRKCLEIKEMTLDKDSRELGNAYRDLAESYISILNFTEALPFCLKAIQIHKEQLGNNSVEVARDRRLLGVVYTGLEEHEKALEQNQLSQKVLKNWGLSSDLLRAEIDAANMQIALGRYAEAINTLKGVVQETDKESEDRALVFISMAKALCYQEKNADSKKCLEISIEILAKREKMSPLEVSDAYLEISTQYEAMNEFETAIGLLKRALSLIERLPQQQHSEGNVSARIGWLLLLTGKVEKAIPYLETGAERLKDCFGSMHFGVGYVYNNLGAAYMELDRPQSAAQVFAMAKEIMEVSLGPVHVDTIDACQNLAKAYDAMKSYPLAIKFQEHVVESWEGHGLSALDERREAKNVLEQLKRKASGDDGSSDKPGIKTLLLPHSSNGSRHNINTVNQRQSGVS